MEVTKWLKPSISVSRIGDSASVQAVTRVNAEQSSKRTMRRPTRQPFRGRLIRLGEQSEEYAQPLRRGSGDSMYTRKAYATAATPSGIATLGSGAEMKAVTLPSLTLPMRMPCRNGAFTFSFDCESATLARVVVAEWLGLLCPMLKTSRGG
jgi:hypothetical protein